MFAKTIILSDAFLDMPPTARCLYFTLAMVADDDGFVNNPRSIMRQCGATEDDAKILVGKKFVIVFDDGVIVIKHWRIHNLVRSDRYVPTKYQEHRDELFLDKKNAYTTDPTQQALPDGKSEEKSDARQKRIDAYNESDLPSSFEYKIRQAFEGQLCPICGYEMRLSNEFHKPTIQHNTPISLGGKHELDNISVICSGCNHRIQNRAITPPYNTNQVKEVWDGIQSQSNPAPQDSIGKDSIGKDRLGKDREKENKEKEKRFVPPSVEEVDAYIKEQGYSFDAESFVDFYESKGWRVGSQPMKDWKAACRTWQRRRDEDKKKDAEKNRKPGYQMHDDAWYDEFLAASLARRDKDEGH
jgi:5-methylcytosine-specific restriction endonuclease McrA